MAELKLGSLFDGSGGFPLAGVLNGIEPVWASEIEPFPIRVTKARFPNMKHLGDVTKINGAEIESVDIITFGSPCQDLSVAGKQLGIHDGQRSNLFFEAIRIIKEMREHDRATGRADDDIRPRFAVWENVPGAFSSNKGADFQAVLQAFCDIEGSGITVPMPPKGKWNHAGCIVGDGFSVAWRVYDAQYWGVPQRRKRIYLIADFGSERAGEILFECEGVPGNPAEGRETREGTAAHAERGVGGSDCVRCLAYSIDQQGGKGGANYQTDVAPTLCSDSHGTPHAVCFQQNSPSVVCAGFRANNGTTAAGTSFVREGCPTIMESILCHVVICFEPGIAKREGGNRFVSDKAMTLRAQEHGHQPVVCVQNTGRGWWNEGEVAETLRTPCGGDSTKANLVVMLENHSNDSRVGVSKDGKCQTLTSSMGTGGGNVPMILMGRQYKSPDDLIVEEKKKPSRKYIVRRLTPTECARLQGFPDWWTDGVEGSDSAKYKMWGNGIALPCAVDVIGRIANELRRGRK